MAEFKAAEVHTDMAFMKPIELPGKRIRYRSGYDGWEPKDILRSSENVSKDTIRFTVALDSDYSNVLLDAYVNRALVSLVQRALSENGLHVVCEDVFAPGRAMPEEEPGTLSEDEQYVLADDKEDVVGHLKTWMYTWSSGGPFYGEFDLVIDMIVPKEVLEPLKHSLDRLAQAHSVAVDDCGCAAEMPQRACRKGFLWRLVHRIK
jgi:hypothetical protein